jgi:outer membrane protein insertion porin family
MIRPAKFSIIIFLLFTSITFSQKLSSFDVSGNFDFDDSQYLQWSGLRINQQIFNGIIDSAKSRIFANILLQGYFYFQFNKFELVMLPDSSTFSLQIEIEEGKPVIIKNIFVNGVDSISVEILIEKLEYLKGQIFNKADIEYNIDQLLINYENTGHPFAKVIVSAVSVYKDSTNEENYADILLKLETGLESKIDKVEIRGTTSTKDYVIIRELRINSGELYSQNRVEEFPKRLNRLRFFEPVPIPQYYINSKDEGVLLVEVKDKNTNNFDGILGYIPPAKNEASGYVTGLVNVSLRNLFGTGRAASIRWNKFDRKSQELDLKYLEPWFLSFPINLNFNLYQRIQDSTYVQQKFEGAVEYLATENISASVNIATESVVPTVRTIPVFTVYNSSYLTTGLNLKIDTRDDPYAPTSGLVFINSYFYTTKTINGPSQYITPATQASINLQRISASIYFFYELFARQVIAIGVNGKELRGPTFENSDLYKLGGANSLRGYREDQFLGSRVLWSNLEFRSLFTRRSYGFVFFDSGYYLRSEEPKKNILKSEEFLYGYGLGLNLETGFGVLRVSFALGKGDSFSDGKIHFGILNEF